MDLISVDCPNCGASLPPREPCGAYRCDYCGGRFQLNQAKKAKTQAGLAVDPHALAKAMFAAQHGNHTSNVASPPSPVQTNRSGRTLGRPLGLIITAVAIMVFTVSILVPLFVAYRHHAGDFRTENVLWDGVNLAQPVTIAGKPAVVGRTRVVGDTDALYCGVYTNSGEKIWRTESLGTHAQAFKSAFCLAIDDVMIVTDHLAKVRILDLATGDQRRETALTDVAAYVCLPPDPSVSTLVWIKQVDARNYLLDPTTAMLTEAAQPDWCYPSQHDERKARQGGGTWGLTNAEHAPVVEGLNVQFVFIEADVGVALGYTAPGTKVPTAVGFDLGTKAVKWQQVTPTVAKSSIRHGGEFGVIAGDKFVTTYGAGRDEWYITAFDVQTGARVWETKLRPIFSVDKLDSLVASDTHAYLERTSSLDIFDVATGKLTGTIGNETYD